MRKLLVLLLVQILLTVSDYLIIAPFFTAEAKAIDTALYHIRDQSEKQFIIYSDSLSVLKSLKDLHHRNPLIQQVFKNYYYLSVLRDIVFCWLPRHTNIRGNGLADLEAKSALSLMITNFKILYSDFKFNIRQYINNKCQSIWEKQTQNKLNEIKPYFNSKCAFSNYCRKYNRKSPDVELDTLDLLILIY